MTDERVTRPELAREGPVRDPAKMWASMASARREQASDQGEASVSSAYDVIDRYMKEGQRIAAKFGDAYSELDLSENLNEMQARWFELTGELMANWFDMLGAVGDRNVTADRNPGRRGRVADVEFEVVSKRPVRLSAGFSPGAEKFELSGAPARCSDQQHPGIKWTATSAHGSNRIRISTRVKRKQPPGRYTANIANAHTGEILGSLTIDVL